MKAKNTVLPSRVDISRLGDDAVITLWDGIYTETVREASEEAPLPDIEYEYDIYQLRVRNRENLAEAVADNFDVWYQAAKEREIEAGKTKETPDYYAFLSGLMGVNLDE